MKRKFTILLVGMLLIFNSSLSVIVGIFSPQQCELQMTAATAESFFLGVDIWNDTMLLVQGFRSDNNISHFFQNPKISGIN